VVLSHPQLVLVVWVLVVRVVVVVVQLVLHLPLRLGLRLRNRLLVLLHPLLEVHFGVPLLLVGPRELPSADVAREGLLARVRPNVGGEVVGAREGAHANAALKRFLACVDPNVAGQFVGSREPPIAVLHRTRVRPFVHWRLARPVRVLSRFHRH